jgi:hypothetical protein
MRTLTRQRLARLERAAEAEAIDRLWAAPCEPAPAPPPLEPAEKERHDRELAEVLAPIRVKYPQLFRPRPAGYVDSWRARRETKRALVAALLRVHQRVKAGEL